MANFLLRSLLTVEALDRLGRILPVSASESGDLFVVLVTIASNDNGVDMSSI